MRFKAVLAAIVLAGTAACGGGSGSSPTSPGSPVVLSGTYSGSAQDTSGPGRMTWQVSQSGTSVSGTATLVDTATNTTLTGTISGSVSGSTLTFQIAVASGASPTPGSSCSASSSGTAQVTATTINGTYTGTNSCTGAFSNGTLSLSK